MKRSYTSRFDEHVVMINIRFTHLAATVSCVELFFGKTLKSVTEPNRTEHSS